ncbi:plasma membrane fusion protein PRM1 [Xylariomycetidae sp. FL0641]|nr:plasma membrane fusion protein PRM1 [Xylariomycetidae sp. FL0641]
MWFRKGGDDAPSVPNTIAYDGPNAHQMYDEKPGPPSPRSPQPDPSAITPYLAYRSRMSQIWFNRWTVLLLLVLVHFLLTIGSLRGGIDDAKTKALSACTKVEDVGSAMASMPHYLSVGVNQLTAKSITGAVHALMTVLDMILTGVEQLILFVISMLTDTYVCLIAMVIHGGLNLTTAAIDGTTDAFNGAIQGIADELSDKANDIQNAVNDLVGGANAATSVIGKGGDARFDAPDVVGPINDAMDKLKDVHIDASKITAGIDKLNDNIPTFDDVKNITSQVISYPFNLIKDELHKAYGDWSFDDTVFPVAEKKALSFCSDNDKLNKFFVKLFELADTAKKVGAVLISLLAVAVCIPMAIMEKRRWKRQNFYAEHFAKHGHDTLDFGYMYSRPLTSRVGLKVSSKLAGKSKKPVRHIMTRWCIAYATSLPALFVLSLALAGFFSALCQTVLLKALEHEVPALESEVGDFANDVVGTLKSVSQDWADDTNRVIGSFSDDINNDILGKVTNGTAAVNATLNTFMKEIDDGITTVFGDTVFADLATDAVRCLIGLKVEAVERGLTWVHDHAHVDFPLLPADVFAAGANSSLAKDSDLGDFLASPSAVTGDEVTDAVAHVTTWLYNNVIQEALIALGLLLLYVIIVLVGVIRMLTVLAHPPDDRHDDDAGVSGSDELRVEEVVG